MTLTGPGLADLAIGDLVEVHIGNPLEDFLVVVHQLLPYFADDTDSDTTSQDANSGKNARKSGNPAKKAAAAPAEELAADEAAKQAQQAQRFGIAVMRQMYVEIQESTVSDVMLKTDSGVRIVATVAREFLTEQVAAMLRSSYATILGKVTALPGDSESINLTRRTAMGAMDGEQARQVLNSFTGTEAQEWNPEDPIVLGPTAQIVPLAIHV